MANQVFGDPTGTVTTDEIKHIDDAQGNVLDDATEESSNVEAQGEEGEAAVEPVEGEEEQPKQVPAAGDDAQRNAIADELGYDIAALTPKQASIIEEVIAQIEASDTDATTASEDASLTDIEREVREAKTKAIEAAATAFPKAPAPRESTITDNDVDPIRLDPAQHYTTEAQLYSDSMDAKLSEPQRRRAFEELREHRRYEFAKDLVYNLKSKAVLDYLREQILQDVGPKIEQFDKLNATASQIRVRQVAERNAILQLSKLDKTDPDIAGFVKPSGDGQTSTYQKVLRSDPRIAARVARLGENPEYADLPADRRAVLHEIDRIRLAHDLAPRESKTAANASTRVAKVKAAAALVKKGSTVSSAAAKAAASIIAKRAAGAVNGGNSPAKGADGQRRFANPDAERMRIAANKSSGIFG